MKLWLRQWGVIVKLWCRQWGGIVKLWRRQWGDIVKLSSLQHFVTVNATAADGHKSCVIVHCNQML